MMKVASSFWRSSLAVGERKYCPKSTSRPLMATVFRFGQRSVQARVAPSFESKGANEIFLSRPCFCSLEGKYLGIGLKTTPSSFRTSLLVTYVARMLQQNG